MANKLIMAVTPDEAVRAMEAEGASAAFLAGGTEVNRLGSSVSADTLISLKRCEGLKSIKSDAGYVTIGAMVTFQEIAESDEAPAYLKEAARFMASRTKRNMATIGGNIAAMRSDSYIIPALMAAGAVMELGDGRSIGVEEYTCGGYEDALILSVTVPTDLRIASKRYSNTAQSHAVLTMSAALTDEGIYLYGAVKNAGLLHFCDLEKRFREEPDVSEDEIIEMVMACTGLDTADDMFGSDEYKRYLIAVTAYDLHRQLTGKEV